MIVKPFGKIVDVLQQDIVPENKYQNWMESQGRPIFLKVFQRCTFQLSLRYFLMLQVYPQKGLILKGLH